MSTNPYEATASKVYGDAPRGTRGIAIAVWCGIASTLFVGIPSLLVLLAWTYSLISYSLEYGEPMMNTVPKELLITFSMAIIGLLLAFGIYKRSRVCATLAWLVFSSATAYAAVKWSKDMGLESFAIPFILIALSGAGMLGTIFHHRRKVAAVLS